jgi:hypothetical protein
LLQFSPVPNLEIKNDETPTKSSHHVVIDWRWSHIHRMSLLLYLVGPCLDCWHHLVEFSKVWRQFVNTQHHNSAPTLELWATLVAEGSLSSWGFGVQVRGWGFPCEAGGWEFKSQLDHFSLIIVLWATLVVRGVSLWPEVTKAKSYSLNITLILLVWPVPLALSVNPLQNMGTQHLNVVFQCIYQFLEQSNMTGIHAWIEW